MGLKATLDVLSALVEEYESAGMSVQQVETRTSTTEGGVELHATVALPVALCGASNGELHPELSPQGASVDENGELQVEFALTPPAELLPDPAGAAISTRETDVHVTDDATIMLTVDVVVDPADLDSAERSELKSGDGERSLLPNADSGADRRDDSETETDLADELRNARDEDVPPFEDTPYLQTLYDSCDTFVEMSDRIEMDVAAETVRRYMIDAGVHSPTDYDTSGDEQSDDSRSTASEPSTPDESAATGPSPAADDRAADSIDALPDKELVTDGLGLPSDLQIEDVADAVVESRTIYEVQRALDLERQCTRDLLTQLDLLDLVMGRLADGPEQNGSYEEVAVRIQQCTPAGG